MNLNVSERLIWSLRGLSRSTDGVNRLIIIKPPGSDSFNLQGVIPPALEAAARSGRRTRGAGLRQLESMGGRDLFFQQMMTAI